MSHNQDQLSYKLISLDQLFCIETESANPHPPASRNPSIIRPMVTFIHDGLSTDELQACPVWQLLSGGLSSQAKYFVQIQFPRL